MTTPDLDIQSGIHSGILDAKQSIEHPLQRRSRSNSGVAPQLSTYKLRRAVDSDER